MVTDLANKVINKKPYLETKIVTYVNNTGDDGIKMFYSNEPRPMYPGYEMKENIDRIKLPCFCTFEWRGKRRLGMIAEISSREQKIQNTPLYALYEIDKQTNRKVGSKVGSSFYLHFLINSNKINIGKAKIIYYETV